MSNTSPHIVGDVFARLDQRDVEQFYAGYQRWRLQEQIATLQTRIDDLYLQIFDVTERMQTVQPSAIALATLARLQANGVNDVELLDRMLERGESWLDQTMQRLDYCEQLDDFIRDDYTQWCKHALEGAYDWIGSIQDTGTSSPAEEPVAVEEEQVEAIEELFLQKLNSDEDEDETLMLETTLKRQAVALSSTEEATPIPAVADTPASAEAISPPGEPEPAPAVEETAAIPASDSDAVQVTSQESADFVPVVEEESPPLEVSSAAETPVDQEAVLEQTSVPTEQEPAQAFEETSLDEETAPPLEEHIPATEESVAAEALLTSPDEQPGGQEFIAPEEPSLASPEPAEQIEEPVPSEAPHAESEKDEANVQAGVPQDDEPHPQDTVAKQRPSFIVRLLRSIWGS